MIEVQNNRPYSWKAQVTNESEAQPDGLVMLSFESESTDLIVRDDDGDLTIVSFTEPDDLRTVAEKMLDEADELQTRLDIAEGIGGDQ